HRPGSGGPGRVRHADPGDDAAPVRAPALRGRERGRLQDVCRARPPQHRRGRLSDDPGPAPVDRGPVRRPALRGLRLILPAAREIGPYPPGGSAPRLSVVSDARTIALTRPVAARTPRTEPMLRIIAMAALALTVIAGVASLIVMVGLPAEPAEQLNSTVAASLLTVGMVGLAVAGAVLAWQQPRSGIAWLMLATALAWLLANVSLVLAWWLLERDSAVAPVAGWFTNW